MTTPPLSLQHCRQHEAGHLKQRQSSNGPKLMTTPPLSLQHCGQHEAGHLKQRQSFNDPKLMTTPLCLSNIVGSKRQVIWSKDSHLTTPGWWPRPSVSPTLWAARGRSFPKLMTTPLCLSNIVGSKRQVIPQVDDHAPLSLQHCGQHEAGHLKQRQSFNDPKLMTTPLCLSNIAGSTR